MTAINRSNALQIKYEYGAVSVVFQFFCLLRSFCLSLAELTQSFMHEIVNSHMLHMLHLLRVKFFRETSN